MPNVVSHFMNVFPSLILRSPFHAVMSQKYAIIEFTGRKTGRQYHTPIAYVRDGDRILISTDSPWWRNLSGGAPVRMRLCGRMVSGIAVPVTDPARATAILRRLVDRIPSYARPAGLVRQGEKVSDGEIARAVSEGRISIEIHLEIAQ
ncbi:MAG: nitroreductase/quinone reductase family protein [Thermomicrobiales bacterium]